MAEGVAKNGPFCSEADEGRNEEGKRAQRSVLKNAVDQHEARGRGSLHELAFDFERGAKITEGRNAAETLRAQFQEETVARNGLDDAARAGRGFEEMSVNAGFSKGVGTDEARDAATDNKRWDVTGHGDLRILVGSECFRKERLGDELLFFEIRVENHSQVSDEDAAEPGGADFAAVEEHEAILA